MYIYLYSYIYIYIFYNRHLKITNLSTTQKFARMHCKNVIYIYRSFTVETKQLQLAWFSRNFLCIGVAKMNGVSKLLCFQRL